MKKGILNMVFLAGLTIASTGCKNDKGNQAQLADAKEAAVPGEETSQYEIDAEASTIEWKGTKPTGQHIGTIDILEGMLTASEGEIESGKVTFDMKTISVKDENISDKSRNNLENHLKGTVEGKEADFFDVNKYPTATFEVTGITEKEGNKVLQGNLTIKEQTKNIEIPVTTSVEEDQIHLESETFTLDRTDWGVNFGSRSVFDNLGDSFIDDEMELKINVKANRS